MSQDEDQHRTRQDRIVRLRLRLDRAIAGGDVWSLAGIMKGILDLLADEGTKS